MNIELDLNSTVRNAQLDAVQMIELLTELIGSRSALDKVLGAVVVRHPWTVAAAAVALLDVMGYDADGNSYRDAEWDR